MSKFPRQFAILLALLLAFQAFSWAAASPPVGLISALKGPVQLKKDNKWGKASMMQSLPDGAHLKVGPNGQAVVVLFQSGARFQLAANSEAVVSASSCKAVSGAAPKSLAALPIRQTNLLKSSSVATGRPASTVLRGKERIFLNSLADTATLETNPTFRWQAVEKDISYQIQVEDEMGKVIWKDEIAKTEATYPATAPALRSGIEYYWTISTRVEQTPFQEEGVFRILSPEERETLTKELAALPPVVAEDEAGEAAVVGVLRAEVYAHAGLRDEAIEAYQKLAEQFPDSEAVRETLVDLRAAQKRAP